MAKLSIYESFTGAKKNKSSLREDGMDFLTKLTNLCKENNFMLSVIGDKNKLINNQVNEIVIDFRYNNSEKPISEYFSIFVNELLKIKITCVTYLYKDKISILLESGYSKSISNKLFSIAEKIQLDSHKLMISASTLPDNRKREMGLVTGVNYYKIINGKIVSRY